MMIQQKKLELANQNKRGISFLFTAGLYWFTLAIISLNVNPEQAFIVSLWGTAFIFPVSVIVSKIIKANIFFKNELSNLGVWANVFQAFFFPVFFISAKANIHFPPIFMGILAGAHFIFYYWLFNSRSYLFITFSMVITDYLLGYYYFSKSYSVIGFANATLLIITCILLIIENRMATKEVFLN